MFCQLGPGPKEEEDILNVLHKFFKNLPTGASPSFGLDQISKTHPEWLGGIVGAGIAGVAVWERT